MSATAGPASIPYAKKEDLFAKLAAAPTFQNGYADVVGPHHGVVLQHVMTHNFKEILNILKSFWTCFLSSPTTTDAGLVQAETLALVTTSDGEFYETVIQQLIPDVFSPMDTKVTKQIRSFAKCIGSWLTEAMVGFPEIFVKAKLQCALIFGQKLRRYTGLNHLVQAAREVLKNGDHVLRMQQDYEKVDFSAVQKQVMDVCDGCSTEAIGRHEAKFKDFQRNDCTITKWAGWLQGIVAECMGEFDDDKSFGRRGSQLLLRWSFISSLIIRDLTLRSATSFGPFHLMRLLCDEYMYFLVEAAKRARACREIRHESLKDDAPAILPKTRGAPKETAKQWLEETFECVRGSAQALNVLQLHVEHFELLGEPVVLAAQELGDLLKSTFMLQNVDATNCVELRKKVNKSVIGAKRPHVDAGAAYTQGGSKRVKLEDDILA